MPIDEFGNEYEDDDQSQNDSDVTLKRSAIRSLEASAKSGKKAIEEVQTLRRKIALMEAGIPTTKLGELFVKAYDGPIDDVSAIKQAAIEYGIFGENTGEPQGATDEEINSARNIADAANGAKPPSGTPTKPDYSTAQSEEEVIAMARQAGRLIADQ